jgi:Trk-type K+ transport system membrane component
VPTGPRASALPLGRRIAGGLRPETPATFIITAFLVLLAAGTAVLMVPVARNGEGGATLWQALFTATSAISVTGLTIVDTAEHWTPLGQLTILVLVQIGGLGIMTSAALLGLLTLRRLGLAVNISAVAETRSIGRGVGVSDVRTVLANVLRISLAVELAVAAVLAVRFAVGYDEPLPRALWLAVFHAVSAFNCAGFALYSDSLARFVGDPWVLVPMGLAVLLGSLGFPVMLELVRNVRAPRRWSINSLLVLSSTAVLLPLSLVAIVGLEWGNPQTIGTLSVPGKLLAGAFETVVPRSAGFTTIDVANFQPATWLVLDVLMFIGSGPAGTGGGIKLTTATVLLLAIRAEARGDDAVEAFGRRIPRQAVRTALAVALLATGAVVLATLALTVIGGAPLDRTLFEVVSAFSTTGLSTGLTAELPVHGQALLVVLMLVGRLGPITLATALTLRRRTKLYQLPEERPIIG